MFIISFINCVDVDRLHKQHELPGDDFPTPQADHVEDQEPVEETIEDNKADIESLEESEEIEEDLNPYDFVLTFAGDINFDENWSTMNYYNRTENGIYDCISPELIQIMQDADIMSQQRIYIQHRWRSSGKQGLHV